MDVIIIEDSPLILERISSTISSIPGTNITGNAADAQSAIELVKTAKPQLVVLDLLLRSGNGLEVLREIRKQKIPSKVVVLTNYGEEQYRQVCFEEGADYFLDKSSEFDQIEEIVQILVAESVA
jgi:two-component system OmpR family response regulator